MHEFTLASEIVSAVRESLRGSDCPPPRVLRVRVGELSGLNPDSLRFCLEAVRENAGDEAMGIEVVPVKPRLVCPECGEVELAGRFDTLCPKCGAKATGFAGGREMEVELECGGVRTE